MVVLQCRELKREMLPNPVDLSLEEGEGFDAALRGAWRVARELKEDPMLLAWYDEAEQRWSPPVDCCGDDEPAWLVYARSRGADLSVSVDNERFVFVFWGEARARSGRAESGADGAEKRLRQGAPAIR